MIFDVIFRCHGWRSSQETVVYGFIIANVIWLGIDAVVNQEDALRRLLFGLIVGRSRPANSHFNRDHMPVPYA